MTQPAPMPGMLEDDPATDVMHRDGRPVGMMSPGAYGAYRTEANSNLRLGAARGLQERNQRSLQAFAPEEPFPGMSTNDIIEGMKAAALRSIQSHGRESVNSPLANYPTGTPAAAPSPRVNDVFRSAGLNRTPRATPSPEYVIGPDGHPMERLGAPLAGVPLNDRLAFLQGRGEGLPNASITAMNQASGDAPTGLFGKYRPGAVEPGAPRPSGVTEGRMRILEGQETAGPRLVGQAPLDRSQMLTDRAARKRLMDSKLMNGELGEAMRQRWFAKKSGDRIGVSLANARIRELQAGSGNQDDQPSTPGSVSEATSKQRADMRARAFSMSDPNSATASPLIVELGFTTGTPVDQVGEALRSRHENDPLLDEDISQVKEWLDLRYKSEPAFAKRIDSKISGGGLEIVRAILRAPEGASLSELLTSSSTKSRSVDVRDVGAFEGWPAVAGGP